MYAIIENGTVINTVVWDGGPDWEPPSGTTAVEVTDSTGMASIGFTWDGNVFTDPNADADIGSEL